MKRRFCICLTLLLAFSLAVGSFCTVSLAYPRFAEGSVPPVATGTDAFATDTDAAATGTDAVATDTDATGTDAVPCAHENTVVKDADAEVCTKEHFTGRVYCADCGELLDEGAVLPPAGHRFRYIRQEADTVMHEVIVVVACEVCGLEKSIPLSEYNVPFADCERAFADGGFLIVREGFTAADVLVGSPADSVLLTADGVAAAADQLAGSGMTLLFPSSREYAVVLYGDADGDGVISPSDARIALRLSVHLEEHTDWLDKACHVQYDGKRAVTSADARLILRASVGLENAALFGKSPAQPGATPTDATPTDAAPQPGAYVCEWESGVNLRSDHSLDSQPLAVIQRGEAVTVKEIYADHESGETVLWGKILYRDSVGWSKLQYFKPVQNTEQEDD